MWQTLLKGKCRCFIRRGEFRSMWHAPNMGTVLCGWQLKFKISNLFNYNLTVTECFRFTKTFYEDLFINVSILLCFPSRMYDHDVDVFFFFSWVVRSCSLPVLHTVEKKNKSWLTSRWCVRLGTWMILHPPPPFHL